jgi:hypothetical protein
MLTELRLQNFRCFDDHTIPLRATTIVVGPNNAGKSTIVEALRLVSIVVARARNLPYRPPAPWVRVPARAYGVSPSLKGLEINLSTMFHHLGDPPAVITAVFDSKQSVTIRVGEDGRIHAVIADEHGRAVRGKAEARSLGLPEVAILPQVGPLAREERILDAEYVRGARDSSLAPLHFRNQLAVFYADFPAFRKLAESTWPGLQIKQLHGRGDLPGSSLRLLVRDRDFVAEVGLMGHGLQMWLQTMWFLARASRDATVILDEPDVYLHADLQRKLILLLRGRHRQTVIATHSVEIMAQVDAGDVLVVNRRRSQSVFANSPPAVQRVIDHIGGVHNLQLTRLWTCRRALLIEGKDVALLKTFQTTLLPSTGEPFDAIPNLPIGGWGGWSYAVGSSMLLKNAVDERIVPYCILDRDYHTDEEIEERYREADERGVRLHIWRRKEIENYLLVPSAIERVLSSSARRGISAPTGEAIRHEMRRIADDLREETTDAMADAIHARNRGKGKGAGWASRQARAGLEEGWGTWEGRIALVSGKAMIGRLSEWSQGEFKVGLGAPRIARELRADEIADEVADVVRAVDRGERLPPRGVEGPRCR